MRYKDQVPLATAISYLETIGEHLGLVCTSRGLGVRCEKLHLGAVTKAVLGPNALVGADVYLVKNLPLHLSRDQAQAVLNNQLNFECAILDFYVYKQCRSARVRAASKPPQLAVMMPTPGEKFLVEIHSGDKDLPNSVCTCTSGSCRILCRYLPTPSPSWFQLYAGGR